MNNDTSTSKQLRTSLLAYNLAEKTAKALTKKQPGTFYMSTVIELALQEYVVNHPELGVKA
jgi:hypothetical protein